MRNGDAFHFRVRKSTFAPGQIRSRNRSPGGTNLRSRFLKSNKVSVTAKWRSESMPDTRTPAVEDHEENQTHFPASDASQPRLGPLSKPFPSAAPRTPAAGLSRKGGCFCLHEARGTRHEADDFRLEGADLVLVPYADAAKEAADKLLREHRQHNDSHTLGVGV